jgi:hypothetical protein
MTDIKKNYTTRDFSNIRPELEQIVKRYYPNAYKDFSASSFNSAILSLLAYLGDKNNFYIDYYNNEANLFTANNRESIYKHAYSRGYVPNIGNTAVGTCSFYVKIPADGSVVGPDTDYIPALKAGSVFAADAQTFLLVEDVFFSDGEVRVGDVDSTTGSPTNFIIKKTGTVISGDFAEESFAVGTFESFLKVRLQEQNVSEIISVMDAEGNEYFEVKNLSQNVIYVPSSPEGTGTENSLKMVAVPRRFVFGRDANGAFLVFGSGSDSVDWEAATETPQVFFDMTGKTYTSNQLFEPAVLVAHDKFGVAPEDTTLTIVYRRSSTSDVKIGVSGIKTVVSTEFQFQNEASLSAGSVAEIVASLEVQNEEPIVGYYVYESNQELKQRVIDFSSTQGRIVNLNDYKAFTYNMPRKSGSVKRCNAVQVETGTGPEIHLFVLSEDEERKLTQANSEVKKNLATWISGNKLVSDVVKIFDAYIVNLGVEFEFIAAQGRMKQKIKSDAIDAARLYYYNTLDIGEPFSISALFKVLHAVPGVLDVTRVHVFQKIGGDYSDVPYNLQAHRGQDGLQYNALQNVIFEVKYPLLDVTGEVR